MDKLRVHDMASQSALADEQEKLGVILEKEDEMDCAVSGCNFLLKAVRNEAFSYENGQANFKTGGQTSHFFYYLMLVVAFA